MNTTIFEYKNNQCLLFLMLGRDSYNHELLSFIKVVNSNLDTALCTPADPLSCFVIDTDSLQFDLHDETTYCVTVKAEGINTLQAFSTGCLEIKGKCSMSGLIWELAISESDGQPVSRFSVPTVYKACMCQTIVFIYVIKLYLCVSSI